MASVHQMTGMLGVYRVAAELTSRGFIVSTTSRSAAGADLLVTDQECKKTWSVQVKTNRAPAGFWLLGKHDTKLESDTHLYVFVNLRGIDVRPEYIVAQSLYVAEHVDHQTTSKGSEWYSFAKANRQTEDEGWGFFGIARTSEEDHVDS